MAWVKLDDGFPEHPKVLKAGDNAAWLYVCGLAYANRHLTDGFIPIAALARLTGLRGPKELAERLCDAGLWEKAPGGYAIHDYGEYQPKADDVTAKREAGKARVRAYRERRNALHPNHSNPPGNEAVTRYKNDPVPGPGPGPNPVVEQDLQEDSKHRLHAADAAGGGRSVSALMSLSPDARQVVDWWRSDHGRRAPPKLNPTQAAALEEAVADLGMDRLRDACRWSAEQGVTEFIKAVRAARTKRERDERTSSDLRNGNGKPPAARGGGGSVRHI